MVGPLFCPNICSIKGSIVAPVGAGYVSYAELHCHSSFSFLDGASHPEELVAEASRLGLEALALTDHDGLYGVVRFFEAARELGMPAVYGAELTLGPGPGGGPAASAGVPRLSPRSSRGPQSPGGRTVQKIEIISEDELDLLHSSGFGGRSGPPAKAPARTRVPDPAGTHLLVLAKDAAGYTRLAKVLSEGHLAGGEKGRPCFDPLRVAELAAGHFTVLTGCRKGAVPSALVTSGPAAAARELDRLVELFGRENVAVEIWDHGDPLDGARNDALAELAVGRGLSIVATNIVHYATPADRRLASVVQAIRSGTPLDDLDGYLPAAGMAYLRSGAEQARWFARYPGAVEFAAELGRASAFDLKLVAPKLPDFPLPPGETEMSFLRSLVEERGTRRYGPRGEERVKGAWAQIDYELEMIEQLGFPGYFLVVWDIVEFCRRNDIYCQGRGSAASSAVCYVLGITNADAVTLGLLFERFLSPERDGPPDIDVDIESGRREEVIQYVYERYGRECAALVAVVVTYRARSAIRDTGKAFGHPEGQVDTWSKQIERWSALGGNRHVNTGDRSGHWSWWSGAVARELARKDAARPGRDDVAREPGTRPWTVDGDTAADAVRELGIPFTVLATATELEGFPRHLGIHPGGMVICDRPVSEVCPVEWARMEGRTVLQWDKDDCATVGLVKFDLLGLGMLEAIHRAVDLVRDYHHETVDLADVPQEPEVYEMLCRGDSVGVFQVESRAQMATLPRLQPRNFYDLVVEVALIRPGPIQGGSVHPYIRRRNGLEPVTYLHPVFEKSLKKTLGVPLFQEQLMQMAIDAAGFSAAEADQLRQAMGSKRSAARMERLRERLFVGMAARGITGEVAEEIWDKLRAFANFGFPESHSVSFAYLVYVSAWLKLHYSAAFLAALLNSQPMGFWAPHTLVADAGRHGVTVRRPEVNSSAAGACLEPLDVGDPTPAVRLGIAGVKGIGDELAERIAAGRPYSSAEDLARRAGAGRTALEALATAGALSDLGSDLGSRLGSRFGSDPDSDPGSDLAPHPSRRQALWAAGAAADARADRLPGTILGTEPPDLPAMEPAEEMSADLQTLGLSPGASPMSFLRPELESRGAVPVISLMQVADGTRVIVAGIVTHRQRPATAGGTTFLNLEDETGLVNVICSPGLWVRYRRAARSAVILLVRGRLERADGAHAEALSGANLIAEHLEEVRFDFEVARSRDFH
jgi:error-prone DNA polymerase